MKSLPKWVCPKVAKTEKHLFQVAGVGGRVRAALGTKIGRDRLMDVFEGTVEAI